MIKENKQACAPLRLRVILPALAAILLLAAAVCLLHWENAVSVRGEAKMSDYVLLEAMAETLDLPTMYGRERIHALYQDGDRTFALHLSDPWADGGVMHIEGALLRLDQTVGEVNVRVGLIPQRLEEATPAQTKQEVILLNTQMVRRSDYAQLYGHDDHCGFKATVETDRLLGEGWQYCIALADETDGAKNLIETDLTVTPIEGGLAFARVHAPESEAQHD